jgi:hypothetical protein
MNANRSNTVNGEMLIDLVWLQADAKPKVEMVRGRVVFGNAAKVA